MKVKIDREKWSVSSKKSYAYHNGSNDCYEDISYRCYKCKQLAIFTAQQQKVAFEEDKQYIWQRRTLCEHCFKEYKNIGQKDYELQLRWSNDKGNLSKNYTFLCEWLEVLEQIPAYGKRPNQAMINMLRRLAHECL